MPLKTSSLASLEAKKSVAKLIGSKLVVHNETGLRMLLLARTGIRFNPVCSIQLLVLSSRLQAHKEPLRQCVQGLMIYPRDKTT